MEQPIDKTRRLILPLAIGIVLLAGWLQDFHASVWLRVLPWVAFAIATPVIIAYLFIDQSGWRALARNCRAGSPETVTWKICPTAVLAKVAGGDPGYERGKVRLNFIVRVATDGEALYLSAVWIVAMLLPSLRIPWSAIESAHYFDPPGWYKYSSSAGLALQLNYDPGYRKPFVEIKIADPTVYVQLPVDLIADAIANLPAPQAAQPAP